MSDHIEGWRVLAAFPSEHPLDVTLETLVRTTLAFGWELYEVDIDCRYVDDKLVVAILVPRDEDPILAPPLDVRFARPPTPPPPPEPAPEPTPALSPGSVAEALRTEPEGSEAFVAFKAPFVCPEEGCGRGFDTRNGLGVHRSRTHPRPSEDPLPPGLPPEPDEPLPLPTLTETAKVIGEHRDAQLDGRADAGEKWPLSFWKRGDPMLVCEDCDCWYTNTAVTLALHCRKMHAREPTTTERIPVDEERRTEMLAG